MDSSLPDPERPSSAAAAQYSMDTDISKLEAPTFTTLDRGPSQPMLSLNWDHNLNLIGKKVVHPMIHCCDKCVKPILFYGRMIHCKHVFCLQCARESEAAAARAGKPTACGRCGGDVVRVEQAGLGSIYMCSYGGSRYGNNGCRRTYLSHRDLQAHIQHRHMKAAAAASAAVAQPPAVAQSVSAAVPALPSAAAISEATQAIVNARKHRDHERDPYPRKSASSSSSRGSGYPFNGGAASASSSSSAPSQQKPISVISSSSRQPSSNSNLITIPIQDGGGGSSNGSSSNNGDRPPPSDYHGHGAGRYYGQSSSDHHHHHGGYHRSSGGGSASSGYYRR